MRSVGPKLSIANNNMYAPMMVHTIQRKILCSLLAFNVVQNYTKGSAVQSKSALFAM